MAAAIAAMVVLYSLLDMRENNNKWRPPLRRYDLRAALLDGVPAWDAAAAAAGVVGCRAGPAAALACVAGNSSAACTRKGLWLVWDAGAARDAAAALAFDPLGSGDMSDGAPASEVEQVLLVGAEFLTTDAGALQEVLAPQADANLLYVKPLSAVAFSESELLLHWEVLVWGSDIHYAYGAGLVTLSQSDTRWQASLTRLCNDSKTSGVAPSASEIDEDAGVVYHFFSTPVGENNFVRVGRQRLSELKDKPLHYDFYDGDKFGESDFLRSPPVIEDAESPVSVAWYPFLEKYLVVTYKGGRLIGRTADNAWGKFSSATTLFDLSQSAGAESYSSGDEPSLYSAAFLVNAMLPGGRHDNALLIAFDYADAANVNTTTPGLVLVELM
eukprot:TRINITY_DN11293_c0_g1_i1.p1 TRINITY_DN11293_c0_g1~~TRINITY_DN11293_c0_g1_i1.p1  ORF type:complete len:408 (-),score=113.07 TRINITY_DN11293_c0_g1_i1:37-1191(-)